MKISQRLIGLTFILSLLINANAKAQPLLIATDVGAPCGVGINPSGTQNGKTFYSNGTNTVGWSGTQWEWNVSGVLYATNNTNTASLAPCSADFPWTLTATGSSTCGINNPDLEVRGNCSSMTLPVELLYFNARELNGSVELLWETAVEINNEKFEIEQSQNGRTFTKIGDVDGSGSSVVNQKYSFMITYPKNEISYYRLKQVDFDGQFEYSETISLYFGIESGQIGEFYPNPSKSGLVHLEYNSRNDGEILVSVFDVTGKFVVNQIQKISNGNNHLEFDFSDLNAGIYIIKIEDERNPNYRKFIIKR